MLFCSTPIFILFLKSSTPILLLSVTIAAVFHRSAYFLGAGCQRLKGVFCLLLSS
jgi:hypothetical protein